MSNRMYFRCDSHDPAIESDGEFTSHLNDEYFWFAVDMRNARPLREDMMEVIKFEDSLAEAYGRSAIRFLLQHPRCEVSIVDSYGIIHRPSPRMTVADAINELAKYPQNATLQRDFKIEVQTVPDANFLHVKIPNE